MGQVRLIIAGLLAIAVVLGAAGSAVLATLGEPEHPPVRLDRDSVPRERELEPGERDSEPGFLIGTVAGHGVDARTAPRRSAKVLASFGARNSQGAPQVFLLEERVREGWFRALLPVRPNGTTGYLPADSLDVTITPYRLEVDRASFELTLYKADGVVEIFPVGVGTGKTPTPVGTFYLASLLEPPEPDTIYGSFAYGLSAHSETLDDWADGGVVGLHGTNDPSSVGRSASHGCIRMRNRDIKKLVRILPLGAPIVIF